MQINTEISFDTRSLVEALEEKLSEAGADTSIAWKSGKWSVFAKYTLNKAVHVGRAIAKMTR